MPVRRIDGAHRVVLDHPAAVRVELIKGSVRVTGGEDESCLEVDRVDGAPLVVDQDDTALTIGYERPLRRLPVPFTRLALLRRDSADLRLSVPADCPVTIAAADATVTVSQMNAPVAVDNICGDINLIGISGGAECRTGRGLVHAVRVRGGLTVDIHAGDFALVHGYPGAVRAHCIHGSHIVDLADPDDEADGEATDLALTCRVGDITVRLPEPGNLNVELSTVQGEIVSAFPEVTPGPRGRGGSTASGTLGGGAGRLMARAERGRVTLLRTAPAAEGPSA
ncbi:MAG: hypothetical protein AUI10_07075 [Actinobacteria bacterium 13_2_20CM_2_72_6]|nr:MAG: hypothetical protein AUI10_07075 [Actinobacteria bacterium 13_2_20CM_2_72_6]